MTQHRTSEAAGPSAANIIRVFDLATDAQRADGRTWYAQAHDLTRELDPDDPRRAAGVVAALSPRVNWSHNVTLARRAYANGAASGCLGNSCRAANRILAGEDPLDVLAAPKVRAFFTLIADPTDPDSVCIDRHATDVALGARLDDDTRSKLYPLDRRGWYGRFATAYRVAAHLIGATPATVQATTWLAWRQMNLDERHRYLLTSA